MEGTSYPQRRLGSTRVIILRYEIFSVYVVQNGSKGDSLEGSP